MACSYGPLSLSFYTIQDHGFQEWQLPLVGLSLLYASSDNGENTPHACPQINEARAFFSTLFSNDSSLQQIVKSLTRTWAFFSDTSLVSSELCLLLHPDSMQDESALVLVPGQSWAFSPGH